MNLRFKFIPTQKPFYNRTDKHRFASLCFTCADLLSIVHVTYYGDTPPPIRRLTQLTRRSLLSPFLFLNLCGIQSLFPRQHGKARNQPGIKERERGNLGKAGSGESDLRPVGFPHPFQSRDRELEHGRRKRWAMAPTNAKSGKTKAFHSTNPFFSLRENGVPFHYSTFLFFNSSERA
jgi:hypothetical protein